MEPVAKVPIGRVVENHHAQDEGSLQHQQRIVFSDKIMKKLGLGEERLLCSGAAIKATSRQNICRRMETGWCQHCVKQE